MKLKMKENRMIAFASIIALLLTQTTISAQDTSQTKQESLSQTAQDNQSEQSVPAAFQLDQDGFLPKNDIAPILKDKGEYQTGSSSAAGYKVDIKSRFYGYKVGVDRSYTNYGWKFLKPVKTKTTMPANAYFFDLNEDDFDDMIKIEGTKVSYNLNDGTGKFGAAADTTIQNMEGKLGIGDFNGDENFDIVSVDFDNKIVSIQYSDNNKKFIAATKYPCDKLAGFSKEAQVKVGDFDGDKFFDIIVVGNGKYTVLFGDGTGRFEKTYDGTFTDDVCKPITNIGTLLAADFNTDGRYDIMLYGSDVYKRGGLTLMSRGTGTFGPGEEDLKDELGVSNLYGKYPFNIYSGKNIQAARLNNDDIPDVVMGHDGKLLYLAATGTEAYNYSMDLMKMDDGNYRLYYGARWQVFDKNGISMANKPGKSYDGDHVGIADSIDGGLSFVRHIEGPAYYRVTDIDTQNPWWTNNTMDPEVIKVDNKWYMFVQTEMNQSNVTDLGTSGPYWKDRIQLLTSDDGIHFTPKTDRNVVVNIGDEDSYTQIDHEEMIYVPDDPDGKPWWMYAHYFQNGTAMKHMRIRSADPTTFDWKTREPSPTIPQLGNQIGYLEDVNGKRIFVRITFQSSGGIYLSLSKDGLAWENLSTEDANIATLAEKPNQKGLEKNKNHYFLGLATENGTGRITKSEDGKYHILYASTTCNSSIAPDIFFAKGGIGEMILDVSELK